MIDKLDLTLWDDEVEEECRKRYEKAKAKHISNYTEYESGYSTGLFGWKDGEHVLKPDVGEAKWNERYPDGFDDWKVHNTPELTGMGTQKLIDKLNEVIEFLNEKDDTKEKTKG